MNQLEDDTITENGLEDAEVADEHGNLSNVKRKRIVFGKLKCGCSLDPRCFYPVQKGCSWCWRAGSGAGSLEDLLKRILSLMPAHGCAKGTLGDVVIAGCSQTQRKSWLAGLVLSPLQTCCG